MPRRYLTSLHAAQLNSSANVRRSCGSAQGRADPDAIAAAAGTPAPAILAGGAAHRWRLPLLRTLGSASYRWSSAWGFAGPRTGAEQAGAVMGNVPADKRRLSDEQRRLLVA